jgi:hypothetical protein
VHCLTRLLFYLFSFFSFFFIFLTANFIKGTNWHKKCQKAKKRSTTIVKTKANRGTKNQLSTYKKRKLHTLLGRERNKPKQQAKQQQHTQPQQQKKSNKKYKQAYDSIRKKTDRQQDSCKQQTRRHRNTQTAAKTSTETTQHTIARIPHPLIK